MFSVVAVLLFIQLGPKAEYQSNTKDIRNKINDCPALPKGKPEQDFAIHKASRPRYSSQVSLTHKQLDHFLQNKMSFSIAVHRNHSVWNEPSITNTKSALWILMSWCFSTRTSGVTVLIMHSCISNWLWVKIFSKILWFKFIIFFQNTRFEFSWLQLTKNTSHTPLCPLNHSQIWFLNTLSWKRDLAFNIEPIYQFVPQYLIEDIYHQFKY